MSILVAILAISVAIVFFIYINKSIKIINFSRIKRKNISSIDKRIALRERLLDGFSDSLMADPELNIKTSVWDTEEELIEKADVHRSRLKKYGRSMMNGKMLFLGPKGGVYSFTPKGGKKYV